MKGIILLLSLVVLSGCAATNSYVVDPSHKAEKSKRLFYRDLTVVAYPSVSDPKREDKLTDNLPQSTNTEFNIIGMNAPYFVAFKNESSEPISLKKNFGLSLLLQKADAQARYIIIGYSHGISAVGIEKLASDRAENVAQLLVDAGVPRSQLHLFASFSGGGSASGAVFPTIGTHVFKVSE